MDLPGIEEGAGEDQKVIVRSNGTVTYVGKDIAYQMWKFGLLGRDFHYDRVDLGSEAPAVRALGDHVARRRAGCTAVRSRGDGLQRHRHATVVPAAGRRAGFAQPRPRSRGGPLDPLRVRDGRAHAVRGPRPVPGPSLSEEDRKKPYLEMSGRKGLGVRADDLVDALLRRAEEEVRRRNPDEDDVAREETSRRIAVGALRYYMLRFSRNRVVAFDLDDALAFEGETGPYLQYSVVRARNILAKLAERRGGEESDAAWLAANVDLGRLPDDDIVAFWEIPLLLSRTDAVLRQAIDSLELAAVAKHAYVLAQAFNSFYHRSPWPRRTIRRSARVRAAVTRLYLDGMTHLLEPDGDRGPGPHVTLPRA